MRRVLESLGLSMAEVMSVGVFLTDFKRDYDAMNEVYAGFFREGAWPTGTASASPTWCAMRWSRSTASPGGNAYFFAGA